MFKKPSSLTLNNLMAFCVFYILDVYYGWRYFGGPQHNCCFECLEWVNNWYCAVFSVYCTVIPRCCVASSHLTWIDICTHGSEVNKTIIERVFCNNSYMLTLNQNHTPLTSRLSNIWSYWFFSRANGGHHFTSTPPSLKEVNLNKSVVSI